MSKLRRKFITVLAVLFCALLTISTALMIPKTKTAEAYNSQPDTTDITVSEIYNSATGKFSTTQLRSLYRALSGDANTKSWLEVAKKLHITESGYSIADKDILVEFGGKVWIATYLSKAEHDLKDSSTGMIVGETPQEKAMAGYAEDGDIVLTLWLAYNTDTSKFNDSANSAIGTYPSNLYGTSMIRSKVLNNGGQYWKTTSELNPAHNKDTSNNFARFTMTTAEGVSNSVTDYLVAPRYMQWQYQQSIYGMGGPSQNAIAKFDLSNDAWGKTYSDHQFNNGTFFFENLYDNEPTDYYSVWKDDLVWLPSLTEVGFGSGEQGMWHTLHTQRQHPTVNVGGSDGNIFASWLRSAGYDAPERNYCVYGYSSGTNSSGTFGNGDGSNSIRFVRPAIHLNLTKAGGVGFDDDLSAISASIQDNQKIYDATALKVYLPDFRRMTRVDGPNENGTATTKASYDPNTGIFSATVPNEKATSSQEINYELTVEPKTGYLWDDNDGTEKRTYVMHISPAGITANWDNLTRGVGEDVFQKLDDFPITSQTISSGVTFEEKYKVVTNSSDYLPDDSSTWDTSDWKGRVAGDPDFSITQAVTYRVYYEITATHHTPKLGFYDVEVSTDAVKYIANDPATSVKNEQYATNQAKNLTKQSTLNTLFRNSVTFTNNDGALDEETIDSLMSKVNIKLFTKSSSGNRTNITFNDNDILPAGDYYMYLEWKVGPEDRTVVLNETASVFPKFTIDPKTIAVQIVDENGGALTHVYGDEEVNLIFKVNQSDLVGDDDITALKLGEIYIENTTNTQISSLTTVGTYNLTAKQTGKSNYKVNLAPCQYVVTKRPIALQVADEEVGYGTKLDSYTFKPLIETDSLVNGDVLADVMKSLTYSVKSNNASLNLSEILPISTYDLSATAEADNYTFNITAGKLTITKGNFVLDGVTLKNEGYVYNGEPHPAKLEGEFPSTDIKASFRYVNYETGEELADAPVEVGLYLVYASFSHDNSNYNPITEVKAAFIRIAYTQEEANADFPALPTEAELAAAADLAKKKAEAKKTLDEEAQKKKGEIDADVNLSAEEKKAAKDEIDKELKEGNAAIDKAKDKDGVDKAYGDGKKEIEDTTELVQKKGAAKSELDKAAQAKKEAIDNNPDLTDEEKEAAKAEVDKELANGKAEIDGASSVGDVQSTESTTKTNIENIKPEHKGNFPWWILAVIAGAIVLVTVIIIVVVKKRNSDDDDGGYDDYYDDEYDYDEEEESDDGDEAYGF